jgi:hypothetical protein
MSVDAKGPREALFHPKIKNQHSSFVNLPLFHSDIPSSRRSQTAATTHPHESSSIREPKHAGIGIRVLQEVLGQFVDEDLDTILFFRCEIGAFLFQAGRPEEGEAALQTVIREHPEQSRGYAELSSALAGTRHGAPDFARAIALLEQALDHPVVDAKDFDLRARLNDLRNDLRASISQHPYR